MPWRTLSLRRGREPAPFDALAPHVVGEPHGVGAERAGAAVGDARAGAPRGEAEHVHAHGHAAGVAIADLDVAVDHHGAADESHGAHADAVAEVLQLRFDGGDAGVGIAVADDAQAGRLLAEYHRDVLGAAEPDADDGGLAGEAALAELDQRVEIEPLDAVEAVGGKQHAVIAAEQPAL